MIILHLLIVSLLVPDQHASAVVFWMIHIIQRILHNANIVLSSIFLKWSYIQEVWVFAMLWAFLFLTGGSSSSLASFWENERAITFRIANGGYGKSIYVYTCIGDINAYARRRIVFSFGCHWIRRWKHIGTGPQDHKITPQRLWRVIVCGMLVHILQVFVPCRL